MAGSMSWGGTFDGISPSVHSNRMWKGHFVVVFYSWVSAVTRCFTAIYAQRGRTDPVRAEQDRGPLLRWSVSTGVSNNVRLGGNRMSVSQEPFKFRAVASPDILLCHSERSNMLLSTA